MNSTDNKQNYNLQPKGLSPDELSYINNLPPAKGFVDCHNHFYAKEFDNDLMNVFKGL